jgi:hypothetical protein
MKSVSWQVFKDNRGWYLAVVKGKPSCRMSDKQSAIAEASRRNVRIADYERAVLEGNAGRLPSPAR